MRWLAVVFSEENIICGNESHPNPHTAITLSPNADVLEALQQTGWGKASTGLEKRCICKYMDF